MRVMVVACQDATGHREEICVRADTDEKACAAALAILNSWRAVKVTAAPSAVTPHSEARFGSTEPRHRRPLTVAPERQSRVQHGTEGGAGEVATASEPAPARRSGPKIIKKAGPVDWIVPGSRTTTAVGRAMLAAAERKAA